MKIILERDENGYWIATPGCNILVYGYAKNPTKAVEDLLISTKECIDLFQEDARVDKIFIKRCQEFYDSFHNLP
jgi:hypothetical protein